MCILNDGTSGKEVCADDYNYFQFELEDKDRCEKCEVSSYGDKITRVECESAGVLPRGVSPPGVGGIGFGSSPNLTTDHTIQELRLPSERDMGASIWTRRVALGVGW